MVFELVLLKRWSFSLGTYHKLFINSLYLFYLGKKHLGWIFTFWKQLEHKILGYTVSKATLNCMQNTLIQYLVINFTNNIYTAWRCYRVKFVLALVSFLCYCIMQHHLLSIKFSWIMAFFRNRKLSFITDVISWKNHNMHLLGKNP